MSCRPFEKKDLCTPNPCGPGAQCQAGFDRSGTDRPVCTCPAGYRGDPLVSCSRGIKIAILTREAIMSGLQESVSMTVSVR